MDFVLQGKNQWISDRNLEVLAFVEGKTRESEEKPFEQGREPATNSNHISGRVWESNPGHIGGRRVLSPRRHPCSPL